MEFCIGIQSKDARPLAATLRRAIGGLAGIHYTSQVIDPAATADETLLVGLPAGEVLAALRMIKSITARAGGAPLGINIAAGDLKIWFDPRDITPHQLTTLATALQDTSMVAGGGR